MKLFNVLIFLVISSVEVRVRAEVLQTPENCLEAQDYCVIKNQSAKHQIKKDSYVLSFSKGAIAIRHQWKEWSLVKGQLFIKAIEKMSFDVPYGSLEIEGNSVVILEKKEDQVQIQTVFGKSLIKPLGEKKAVVVYEGYENYLTQVDGSLKAQVGIPKPILIEQLLKNWALHTDLSKKEFLDEVEKFKPIHEKAVQELSILNQEIAKREIASEKERKEAAFLRKKNREKEQKRLRESYKARLLGE